MLPDDLWYHVLVSAEQSFPIAARRASIFASHGQDSRRRQWDYPVVIMNWVQYLGPPVPFSFPDSRDLLEVLDVDYYLSLVIPRKEEARKKNGSHVNYPHGRI